MLSINVEGQTKVMFDKIEEYVLNINLEERMIMRFEKIEEFTYLGNKYSNNPGNKEEIR